MNKNLEMMQKLIDAKKAKGSNTKGSMKSVKNIGKGSNAVNSQKKTGAGDK